MRAIRLSNCLPILSEAAAIELISNFPQPVDPKELTLEGSTRIHCIDRLRTVVQPFLLHLELEALFSLLIRRGYVGRNPMSPATVRHLHSLSGLSVTTMRSSPLRNVYRRRPERYWQVDGTPRHFEPLSTDNPS
jgi:hypothetical protein